MSTESNAEKNAGSERSTLGWGGASSRKLAGLMMLLLGVGCATTQDVPVIQPPVVVAPQLSPALVAKAFPEHIKDRAGWAEDLFLTLEALELKPSVQNVASVMAILGQESGFDANPVVPGLSALVQKKLDAYAAKLGPLGEPLMKSLLKGTAKGSSQTFYQRIGGLKTERDLDRLFRDILIYYKTEMPVTMTAASLLGTAMTSRSLEDLNPITTAGSMQVSVAYAQGLAKAHGKDPDQVREEIYTRRGGLYYGTARLLGYEAGYSNPIYRFADYNAGFYSSRNAALQAQLAELTGIALVPDGDLLLYGKDGYPLEKDSSSLKAALAWKSKLAPDLSEATLRRDFKQEKTLAFEETATWKAIRASYKKVKGVAPDYAHLPRVTISSPKMSQDRSTAWFARSVRKRYDTFLARLEALLNPSGRSS